MPLLLVLHDPAPATEAALTGAAWDIAESHWRPAPNLLLVETGVSAAYLAEHLRAALRRAAAAGGGEAADDGQPLLVAECGAAFATGWDGEGGAWVAERLSEPPPGDRQDAA